MRAAHTKKIILACLIVSFTTSTQAFIDNFDMQGEMFDLSLLDKALAVPVLAMAGAAYAHKTFKRLKTPYDEARKHFTDVAQGAKVGSMRVNSYNHWVSTLIEPLAQFHGMGWLRHVSFAARRGPDILNLFVNNELSTEQQAIVAALGISESVADLTASKSMSSLSTILRGKLSEKKGSLHNDKLSLPKKFILLALYLTKYRSFAGDSAGIQLATEQILETFIQYGMYSHRGGNASVDASKWAQLNNSPKFLSAANRLFYSLFTEIGIVNAINSGVKSGKMGDNLLGRYGIDVALFAKDLLMPLAIYRSRFGQNMPDTMKYIETNAVRTALKIFVARAALEKVFGHRDVRNPVFVALRACENEGLFDRQIGFVQGHVYEQFDYLFNEVLTMTDMALVEAGLDVNFGDNSKNAKEVMRHSRDLLYNMGNYPPHFNQNLTGTAAIMLHNQQLAKLQTPGLFGFDSVMEVSRQAQNMATRATRGAVRSLGIEIDEPLPVHIEIVDTSATEQLVRSSERERRNLARQVYRQRDLLNREYGSLLRGVLKERA